MLRFYSFHEYIVYDKYGMKWNTRSGLLDVGAERNEIERKRMG